MNLQSSFSTGANIRAVPADYRLRLPGPVALPERVRSAPAAPDPAAIAEGVGR